MAISLLGIVNSLSPKDANSRRLVRDLPYGAQARQRLDIYAPRGAVAGLPVVQFIYGGSWMDGSRDNYTFVGRALAALGYVVVIADYRLLPEVEYPAFIEDCRDAFAWIVGNIAQYGGDPSRIGVMGHSAGAYNAMMLGLSPLGLTPALATHLRALVGLSGPYDFFPFDGPISLRTFGAVSDPRSTQPINHVRSGLPPVFLGTGDRDELVLPRNSVALAAKLRAAGCVVEEVHYARLGHPGPLLALGRPARFIAPVLRDVDRFLKKVL